MRSTLARMTHEYLCYNGWYLSVLGRTRWNMSNRNSAKSEDWTTLTLYTPC